MWTEYELRDEDFRFYGLYVKCDAGHYVKLEEI